MCVCVEVQKAPTKQNSVVRTGVFLLQEFLQASQAAAAALADKKEQKEKQMQLQPQGVSWAQDRKGCESTPVAQQRQSFQRAPCGTSIFRPKSFPRIGPCFPL